MRNVAHILLACLIIGVMGCSRHADDARLLRADSLMTVAPDSAYAVLAAVDTSLLDDADRAYYALLRTQCDYKCYIPATDSALIVAALAWYQRHPQGDRLTRALLHRGTVAEEMGNPVAAIKWYRHAEASADTADHNMLGYINLRIASLYLNNYVDGEAINYFSKASSFFKRTNDTHYNIICHLNLGGIYRKTNPDSAFFHLNKAKEEALAIGDTANYVQALEFTARGLYYAKQPRKSCDLAIKIINVFPQYVENDVLYDAANAYVTLGMNDSAEYYLRYTNPQADCAEQQALRHFILSRLDFNKQSFITSNLTQQKALSICDSIEISPVGDSIVHVDHDITMEAHQDYVRSVRLGDTLKWLLISLLAALLVYGGIRYWTTHRKNSRYEHDMDTLAHGFHTIKYILSAIASLDHSIIDAQTKKNVSKAIIQLNEDENFWDELRALVDYEQNNVITRLIERHHLTTTEWHFVCLFCMEYKYNEIASLLNINPSYVSGKRLRLERKMGIEDGLREYIEKLKRQPNASV